jgi:hypothetical protein
VGRNVDQARDLVVERRQREPGVADQRDLGRIVGADHRRIDVEMDDLDLARHRVAPALGRDRARPAADEHHQIGPVDQRPGRGAAAVAADHARRQRMVLRDRALAADRGRDRDLEPFRERLQIGLGAGDHRPAAADEERIRRRQNRPGGGRDRGRLGRGPARGKNPERRVGVQLRLVDRRPLDVERQPDVRSTWPAGGHVAKRGAQGLGDHGRLVDHPVPFGQRPEQRLLIELGQHIAAARPDRDVGGHGEHRDRGFVGLDHPRQDVGGAAAARPLADPDPAGDPGVGVGHVGGRALVAREDMADAVVEPVERVVEGQAGIAAQSEDVADAVQLEHAHERLGARELVHRGLPRSPRKASARQRSGANAASAGRHTGIAAGALPSLRGRPLAS